MLHKIEMIKQHNNNNHINTIRLENGYHVLLMLQRCENTIMVNLRIWFLIENHSHGVVLNRERQKIVAVTNEGQPKAMVILNGEQYSTKEKTRKRDVHAYIRILFFGLKTRDVIVI